MEYSYGIIPLRRSEQGWDVLLVQLKAGHFGFPKGHPEFCESPLSTACRELKEETDLEVVNLLSEEPLSETYFYEKDGKKHEKTVYYFLATVDGYAKIQEGEIISFLWTPLQEAANYITFPEGKSLCKNIINLLNQFQ